MRQVYFYIAIMLNTDLKSSSELNQNLSAVCTRFFACQQLKLEHILFTFCLILQPSLYWGLFPMSRLTQDFPCTLDVLSYIFPSIIWQQAHVIASAETDNVTFTFEQWQLIFYVCLCSHYFDRWGIRRHLQLCGRNISVSYCLISHGAFIV